MPALLVRQGQDELQIVGWQSDPDGRGTMGLIWGCILTLALCVWSALHLNIPPKHDQASTYWFRVVRWVLLGVLAPELVLWAAWRQWSCAKILTAEINKILKEEAEEAEKREKETGLKRRDSMPHRRRHKWTPLHSFYVTMGGFVFDVDASTEEEMTYIPHHKRMTLTPEAAILLAKCGYLPDIDPDDIKDKSKADSLAKVLVFMQAGWFLVQTLARLAQQLPVSLLEVNTMGHVLCALVVYVLWWSKPREVGEPTVLYGEWVHPLCSFMYMSSRVSGVRYRRGIRPSAWISPELENLVYVLPDEKSQKFLRADTSTTLNEYSTSNTSSDEIEAAQAREDAESRHVRIKHAPTFQSTTPTVTDNNEYGSFKTEIRRQDTIHTANRKRQLGWEVDTESNDSDSHRQTRRSYCGRAFQTYPAVAAYFTPKPGKGEREYIMEPTQFLVPSAINWPSDFLLKQISGQIVGIVLWFASIMYGSVHLAAWKEYFPSDVEKLLWHLSAGYIAASGLYWTVAHILFYYWSWLDNWWDRFVRLKNHWLQYVVYGFGMTCAGLLYIFCRAYLTIEGIVSLRAAPMEVYETVEWTRFIPHF